MEDTDLIEKLKYMPKDELEAYLLTAKITGGLSAMIGITTIFLALMFSTPVVIIITVAVLHCFGNIAVASTDIKNYIEVLLKDK